MATAPWVTEPTQLTHRNAPDHAGSKRTAEDAFESQSNISNSFKKLRIKHPPLPIRPIGISFRPSRQTPSPPINTTYQSSPPTSPITALPSPTYPVLTRSHYHHTNSSNNHNVTPYPPPPEPADYIEIDETPHRIYIPSLEAEIAQIEADEAAATTHFFLPDVDKKVSSIPQHLLRSREESSLGSSPGSASSSSSQALVLYREPTSISVPEEEDAVRKMVSEARERMREQVRRREREETRSAAAEVKAQPKGTRGGWEEEDQKAWKEHEGWRGREGGGDWDIDDWDYHHQSTFQSLQQDEYDPDAMDIE